MVLVTLGTQNNSFHRLLEEVQKCIDNKVIDEEVVVQAGATRFKSKDMKIFKLVPTEELNKYVEEASYIITHGGVGSIVTGIKAGKKVIAVPRYHKFSEHINDHQMQIIETFDGQGFIKGIQRVEDLEKAIKELPDFKPEKFTSNTQNVINIVGDYIDNNKKILFAAHSLDIGGIETALVTLVNKLQNIGYSVTVALEKKQGIFLKELDKNIKVIEYRPNNNKNKLIRKTINLMKRIRFILKYKNKFSFSACFATYSIPASFVSRMASKNSCLWGHADYLTLHEGSVEKTREFFEKREYDKFKNIVFVSNEGKESFLKVFPNAKDKTIVCNNLINGNKILNLQNEEIDLKRESNCKVFVNVGRHDEKQKRLTRIIESAKKLKKDNYNFKILFIGSGQDTKLYKDMVKKEKLDKYIIFLGKKENPYPYYKLSDCVILTSDYEGYPVVLLESFVLNKPIITTKVSDYSEVEGKHGFVTEKDTNDIYDKMKKFLDEGFEIKEKFDYEKYNEEIIRKIQNIIG